MDYVEVSRKEFFTFLDGLKFNPDKVEDNTRYPLYIYYKDYHLKQPTIAYRKVWDEREAFAEKYFILI